MARKRIGLQFDGWDDYLSKLDELGGTQVMKKGVEEALIESKKQDWETEDLLTKAVMSVDGKLVDAGSLVIFNVEPTV